MEGTLWEVAEANKKHHAAKALRESYILLEQHSSIDKSCELASAGTMVWLPCSVLTASDSGEL